MRATGARWRTSTASTIRRASRPARASFCRSRATRRSWPDTGRTQMALANAVRAIIDVDGWELEQELWQYIEQVVVDEHSQLPQMFSITLLDPKHDVLD